LNDWKRFSWHGMNIELIFMYAKTNVMRNLLFIGLMLFGINASAQEIDYKLFINYGYNQEDQSIEVTVYNNTWVGDRHELVHYPVGLLLKANGDTIMISDDRYYGIGEMSTFRFPLDKALTMPTTVQFKLHSIRLESLYEDWTFEISPDREFTTWDMDEAEALEIEERSPEDFENMLLDHTFNWKSNKLTLTVNSENVKAFISYPSIRVYSMDGGQKIGEHRFNSYGLSGKDTFEIKLDDCCAQAEKLRIELSEGHSTEPIRTWEIVLD